MTKLRFNRTLLQSALLDVLIAEVKASKHFTMCMWTYGEASTNKQPPCGTAACIGGHLAVMLDKLGVDGGTGGFERDDKGWIHVNDSHRIGQFIGLKPSGSAYGYSQAFALFKPRMHREGVDMAATKGQKGYISKKRAVTVLERFRDTGKIDWKL